MTYGRLAQLVEHLLDVQEVTGSSPVPSTTKKSPDRSRIPVDIPTGWEPRAKQSRTVALLTALCAAALFESCTAHHKKIPRPNGLGIVVDGTGLEPVTSCTSSRCSTS